MAKVAYNACLSAEQQVDTEEAIAAMLFDFFEDRVNTNLDEETASKLGKRILYLVLRRFRRDLFVDSQPDVAEQKPLTSKEKRLYDCVDVEAKTMFEIACCVCGDFNNDEDMDLVKFVSRCIDEGWTYGSSEKFQVEGSMCPGCSGTPDKDRGEW
jgi:hypothetical protein